MEAREVIGYAGRERHAMQRGREDRTLGSVATLHVLGPAFSQNVSESSPWRRLRHMTRTHILGLKTLRYYQVRTEPCSSALCRLLGVYSLEIVCDHAV